MYRMESSQTLLCFSSDPGPDLLLTPLCMLAKAQFLMVGQCWDARYFKQS